MRYRAQRVRPRRAGLRLATLLAAALPLVACGASGGATSSGASSGASTGASSGAASGSPGLSLADRASTARVCVAVSGDVVTVVNVGIELAAQSVTPAEAQSRLAPVLAKITTAASQNAGLPVGKSLQHLADAISTASHVDPTDLSAVRAVAGGLGNAGKDVLTSCAAAAR